LTWFWVLLGKYFDKRNNKKRRPESQVFLTKAPKTFGEMSKEERKEFFRGVANQVLPKITSEEYISGNEIGAKMSSRKSRFMFDLPVFTDWLFYLFLFFLFANWFGSFNAVQGSGGINTSTFSVISGSIDAAFGLLISWIMVAPFYWIRRLIRKLLKSKEGI
jgi:hypothetical protein